MSLATVSGASAAAPPPPKAPVFAATISADRSTIVTTHSGGLVARWGRDGLALRHRGTFDGALAPLALSHDGALLVLPAAGRGKTALVDRKGKTDPTSRTLPAPTGRIDAYAFAPDGSWLAIAGAERLPAQPGDKPRLVRTGETIVRIHSLHRHAGPAFEVCLGLVEVAGLVAAGHSLFVLSRDGVLRRFAVLDGKLQKELHVGTRGQVLAVGHGHILAGADDRVFAITPDGDGVSEIAGTRLERISAIDEAPDGTLALAGYDEVLVVVAGKATRFPGSAETGTLSPKAAVLLSGGRLAIFGGTKYVARVLDVATQKVLESLPTSGE